MKKIFLICAMLLSCTSQAELLPEVKQVLSAPQAPEGIVFDIESNDPAAFERFAPVLKENVAALRKKFGSDLDIALVSHGREMQALQANPKENSLLKAISALSGEQSVQIHTCNRASEFLKLNADNYANFVDVSASGAAQVNDYKALDYTIIELEIMSDSERKTLIEQGLN